MFVFPPIHFRMSCESYAGIRMFLSIFYWRRHKHIVFMPLRLGESLCLKEKTRQRFANGVKKRRNSNRKNNNWDTALTKSFCFG